MALFNTGPPYCEKHNAINLIDNPDEVALFIFVAICLDCCSFKSTNGEWVHMTVEILGRFLNGQPEIAREGMEILKFINENFNKDFPEYTEEEYLEFAKAMKDKWDESVREHRAVDKNFGNEIKH